MLALSLAVLSFPDRTAVAPSRLWNRELARLQVAINTSSSDFEKTTLLREYVGALIDIGRPDDRTRKIYQSVNFDSFDPAEFYPLFRRHALAAECGITTFFYIKLLHAFGFKAYQYSFGFTEQPFAEFIHSVALVEIEFHGGKRLIIQDPYLDLTYHTPQGEPIDFFDFLSALKQKHYEQIVMAPSTVMTGLLVPDASLYYPYLTAQCRALLDAKLRGGHGSPRTRIQITRSYPELMQSACGNFEEAFRAAMRVHGLNAPFVYSYTLRASDLVGSADSFEMQRKIDSILR